MTFKDVLLHTVHLLVIR